MPQPIILASGSPRRREFLEKLNIPFTTHTADIDESPLPHETPPELVCRLSREKAQAVAKHHPDSLIIAADTIVVLDDRVLGKPANVTEARHMLTHLRGRDHFVYSAVTLCQNCTPKISTRLNETTVTMRNYTDAEIEAYIASGDPMDKAGAYAIQNPDFAPVAKISGCYASVMGLPLRDLADALAKFGITSDHLAHVCSSYSNQSCCLTI